MLHLSQAQPQAFFVASSPHRGHLTWFESGLIPLEFFEAITNILKIAHKKRKAKKTVTPIKVSSPSQLDA